MTAPRSAKSKIAQLGEGPEANGAGAPTVVRPVPSLAPINSQSDAGRRVAMLPVDSIEVGSRLRDIAAADVDKLAKSMSQIGLRTPISVRHFEVRPDFLPGPNGDAVLLLTGAHRLAAAKSLGWQQIECIIHFDGDEIDAQLWEIAENLSRIDLTPAQRDQQIQLYAKLLAQRDQKPAQIAAVSSKGGRGKVGIASKIAAETGLSKDTVERALNPERKAAEKKRRDDKKAEHQRQRDEARAALPQSIRDAQAFRQTAKSTPVVDVDALQATVAELREANAALEAEVARLTADVAKFEDMRVQYEQGGFEKTIAGKDEEIRVLETRLSTESKDKVSWMNSAEFWKKEAERLGYNDDLVIDVETGAILNG
jgi:ParB-like chromosome segregation protein Spo0J